MAKKSFEYLSGPVSWYEYEFQDDEGNKKMIHLFGDRHDLKTLCNPSLKCMKNSSSEKSNCYDFIYFLKELFDIIVSNEQYGDLFLEFPYNIHRKNIYQLLQNTMIGKIYNQFKDCLQYSKKECKYNPYVRMHYTDLRDSFQEQVGVEDMNLGKISSFSDLLYRLINDLVQDLFKIVNPSVTFTYNQDQRIQRINMIDMLFSLLSDNCKMYQILFESKDYVKDLTKFIDPYLEALKENSTQYLVDDIENFVKVFDLMKKLKHPKSNESILTYQLSELQKDKIMVNGNQISDLIYGFIMAKCMTNINYLDDYVREWRQVSDFILNNPKNTNIYYLSQKYLDKLQAYLVGGINLFILDGYILSRLFRKFSGKKHQTSILSIIYAGDKHIEIEKEFFEKILNLKPIYKVEKSFEGNLAKQCIFSPNLKDIFSYFKEIDQKEDSEQLINKKNFNIIHQDKNGVLLQAKELGPLCELVPELDICSESESSDLSKYYIWIDEEEKKKYIFNLFEELYRTEDNEEIEVDVLSQIKEIYPISSLFEKHEKELLQTSLKYEKNPKLWAKKLYYYARDVLGKRWKDAEDKIIRDPEYSTEYAIYVLKKRWPNESKDDYNLREQAEKIIMENLKYEKKYSEKFNI